MRNCCVGIIERIRSEVEEAPWIAEAYIAAGNMTPVRINISLPKCVLEGLDHKASARGMTRSALIAKVAQAHM